MNLRQLSYFIAVAEHRSMAKAAQALYISQPSISTQIKLLEDELEVQLFERRQEGTILTQEGKEFLGYARVALDTLDAAKASLRTHQADEVGTVTVGIPGSLSPVLSLSLMAAVREQCPNIRLKVVSGLSGHLARWILDNTLDFGLLYSPSTIAGLNLELLVTEQLFLVAQRQNNDALVELCKEGSIAMTDLQHIPLVMPSPEHGLRALVDQVASSANVSLHIRTELDAHELLLEWVFRTNEATILSLAALRNLRIPHDELITAHIVNPCIERRVCLAYASDRPLTRTARRVETILREQLQHELANGWWRYATINA